MIEKEHLSAIDNELEQMIATTTSWANINSGSYNVEGLKKVADLISKAFAALNAKQDILSLDDISSINDNGALEQIPLGNALSFSKRLDAPITILFVGHMDTVFPKNSPFQKVTSIDEHTLQGPGITDMKGGIAVILWALKYFEKHPLASKIGWQVLLTPDEEIGSLGSAKYIEQYAKQHDLGLVYEPSIDDRGTLAGQRKGSGKFTIVAKGRAAHAGRDFANGRSAIYSMAKLLSKIDSLNNQRDELTINAGLIKGGSAVNAVADTCTCFLDVRLKSAEDQSWLNEKLQDLIKHKINDVEFSLHGKFTRQPKIFDAKHEQLYDFVKSVGAKVGENIKWQPTGGCCDGNNLAAAGLVNVDTLGVRGGKIHSCDEYLVKVSLTERSKLTYSLLVELAKRGIPW